jgi:phosphoglycerol transferase MdoB-like AlkP superfamily enzyme
VLLRPVFFHHPCCCCGVARPPTLPVPPPAGIQFIFYALFGHNMIAFSFLLSCFFTSSKTATVFAYLVVFGTGLIGSLLLSQLINAGQWYTVLLELVPSFALFRCVARAAASCTDAWALESCALQSLAPAMRPSIMTHFGAQPASSVVVSPSLAAWIMAAATRN